MFPACGRAPAATPFVTQAPSPERSSPLQHLVKQDLSSSLRLCRLRHPFLVLSRVLAMWASSACSPSCAF